MQNLRTLIAMIPASIGAVFLQIAFWIDGEYKEPTE